jgi:hypothetical protein
VEEVEVQISVYFPGVGHPQASVVADVVPRPGEAVVDTGERFVVRDLTWTLASNGELRAKVHLAKPSELSSSAPPCRCIPVVPY